MARVIKTDIQRVHDRLEKMFSRGQCEHIKHRHVRVKRQDDHMTIIIAGKSGNVKLSKLGKKSDTLQPHWKSIEKCLRQLDSLLSDYSWIMESSVYEILGLPSGDDRMIERDEKHVKSQYKRLIHRHHPDKGGNPEFFDRMSNAKELALAIISLAEEFDEGM